jgi:two-component sensor histidine kinase
MPLLRPLDRLHRWTGRLPRAVPYALAALLVLAGLGVRYAANYVGWPAQGYPFLMLTFSIAGAAALNGGAGYFATAAATLACMPFIPSSATGWIRADWILPVAVFVVLGVGITALVESLTHAIRDREQALVEAQAATRRRGLLLVEYRHRSRGDLQSISSLLRLRARYVDSEAAKAALREAAEHTVALGRIHARLEHARHDADEVAVVNSGCFIRGICADLMPPVTTVAAAVSQALSTERSVSVGLLLVELVAAARRDRAGRVDVRLTVAGDDTFILDVIDDRAAEGETDGLRARLVGLLAVQLRGTVTRRANRAGPGLAVCLRFPVLAPVLAPGAVGS